MLVRQTLRTKNDANGNPRKLVVVSHIQKGGNVDTLQVIKLSYGSLSPEMWRKSVDLGEIEIGVTEYRRILKRATAAEDVSVVED